MRLPGKKFRKERFHVDGVVIEVDLRITEDGEFCAAINDDLVLERPTLHELRDAIQPVLERLHRLQWDPYIIVEYEAADSNSRFDNRRGDDNRQEVTLAFSAVYVSRTTAPWHHHGAEPRRRAAKAVVDDVTCEISPLDEKSRHDAGVCWDTDDLIPFEPHRWRALVAIAAALADVRRRIAAVLHEKNGRLLDALPVGDKMLAALPAAVAFERKGRRS